MTSEIIKELTSLRKTNDVTNKQFLTWAKNIKEWRVQKEMLSNVHDNKNVDIAKCVKKKQSKMRAVHKLTGLRLGGDANTLVQNTS